jgi:tRNA(Ile)-lysidine synthetase-like protein
MSDQPRGSIPLSGGWRVEASPASFELTRHHANPLQELALPSAGEIRWGAFRFRIDERGGRRSLTEDAWTATLPRTSHATVRPWAAGDRLAAAAGHERRRVKRYLSDAGVHGLDRTRWPVVVAGDDVVWIPGVRRSDAATERSGRPVRHYLCERIDR